MCNVHFVKSLKAHLMKYAQNDCPEYQWKSNHNYYTLRSLNLKVRYVVTGLKTRIECPGSCCDPSSAKRGCLVIFFSQKRLQHQPKHYYASNNIFVTF